MPYSDFDDEEGEEDEEIDLDEEVCVQPLLTLLGLE
jgi:hypothetical protein